ncbi:hypothetical protein [Robertkochia aurantiaca]|uniref:hypothetical protein n=1 Tax=Robertkochia aurantiaca TaxID=2873700 RepID=UPI001CC9B579|nr:hypothetical protein [Robertkochia sp. 3YJGBD-33]
MLLNISYNDRKVHEKVLNEVGSPLRLVERFKLGGSGSPKLFITKASLQIYNLLILDNNINTCNIEIRSEGIIIRFRSLLETYALIIPFYKLNIYKGSAQEYTLYRDSYFIRIAAKTPQVHNFMKKLRSFKDEKSDTNIEDL